MKLSDINQTYCFSLGKYVTKQANGSEYPSRNIYARRKSSDDWCGPM